MRPVFPDYLFVSYDYVPIHIHKCTICCQIIIWNQFFLHKCYYWLRNVCGNSSQKSGKFEGTKYFNLLSVHKYWSSKIVTFAKHHYCGYTSQRQSLNSTRSFWHKRSWSFSKTCPFQKEEKNPASYNIYSKANLKSKGKMNVVILATSRPMQRVTKVDQKSKS